MTPLEQPPSPERSASKKESSSEKKPSSPKQYSPQKEWEQVNDDLKMVQNIENEMNPLLPAKGLTFLNKEDAPCLLPNGREITLKKAANYPVLGLKREGNGETWIKIGKPPEGDAEFALDYVLAPIDWGVISQEVTDRDDLRRLWSLYDNLLSQFKQLKNGRGDLQNTLKNLREVERIHISQMTGESEVTDTQREEYKSVVRRIDIGPWNLTSYTLADLATQEKKGFENDILNIERIRNAIGKKMDQSK